MSKRNVELERLLWPKDSLKRALLRDYPGCTSALDALKKTLQNKNQTAAQLPLKEDLPELLRTVIQDLEEKQTEVDVDLISLETRRSLADMPLTTREEILKWREEWIKQIEILKW